MAPEPAAASGREADPGGDLPDRCLDCGADVQGPWCHRCGQRHASRMLPLRRLAADAISELFSLDGRLARTANVLLRRPGELTDAYLAGRRSRYVPPIRLYLAASVIYFTVLAAAGTESFLLFTARGVGEEFEGFVSLLPKLMFVLLPVFALLLKGLSPGRDRLYAEHLVFALHYHTLVFAVYPVVTVLEAVRPEAGPGRVTAGVVSLVLHGYLLAYLAVALRRVHGGSRSGAVIRSLVVWLAYAAVLGIAGTLGIPSLRRYVWRAVTGG